MSDDNSRLLFGVFVLAVLGAYAMFVRRLFPWSAVEVAIVVAVGILLGLLVRGIWLLMRAGDARLESTKAQVKAQEGRNPDDAMTYEQEVEAQAIAYLKKVPLLGRAVRFF